MFNVVATAAAAISISLLKRYFCIVQAHEIYFNLWIPLGRYSFKKFRAGKGYANATGPYFSEVPKAKFGCLCTKSRDQSKPLSYTHVGTI